MHIEDFRYYCLNMKGVTESFPFDETTLVFKVINKMFALTDTEGAFAINLKCDPERAASLKEQYPCVTPGYHMNKTHWITVLVDGSMPDDRLKKLVDDSYSLIVAKLTRKEREQLTSL